MVLMLTMLHDAAWAQGVGGFFDNGSRLVLSNDHAYLANSCPSFNHDDSVAIFVDHGGADHYGQIAQDAIDHDNKASDVKDGGLFVDA